MAQLASARRLGRRGPRFESEHPDHFLMTKTNRSKILNHFKKADPKIYRVVKTVDFDEWIKPWKETYGSDDYYTAHLRSIVGQYLSTLLARTNYVRIKKLTTGE